ncbi:hypothetical protein FOA52_006125 [Chlamydomonas sp. UWO 241]|nr:hypothetical protein FOA52_006125 [Chlamydomonas sp. UWO 241]
MAVAFLLFQAQGILAAVHFRCLIGEARVAAIWRHVYWSGPGNVIMLAGFYAIYQTKIANGKDHFTTLHAKVGLATMVMSIGAQFGGAMSFRAIGLLDKFPAAMRPLIKTAHRNAGSVAWLMGLATIELSLCYPSMAKGAYTPLLQAGVAFMGAAMVGMSLLGQPMSAKSKAQ